MTRRRGTDMRSLIPLGEGAYSVSEVCRILQPGMTPRKVHYWLDTGLLSDPIRHGSRGRPTILSFRQLLEIRTVQHLRDELDFSLPKVRGAIAWVLDRLFTEHWTDLHFMKGENGDLIAVVSPDQLISIPGGQGVLPGTLVAMNSRLRETRGAWDSRLFVVPGTPHVVSNAHVLAGAPVLRGTRIEVSLLASFASDGGWTEADVAEVVEMYPHIPPEAVRDAFEFEGVPAAA